MADIRDSLSRARDCSVFLAREDIVLREREPRRMRTKGFTGTACQRKKVWNGHSARQVQLSRANKSLTFRILTTSSLVNSGW